MKALVLAQVAWVALLTLAVRCLDIGQVFGLGEEVYLDIADSSFHARRALFSFVNFPEILYRDPYMAYPDGAVVPAPPLYDWALGAVARAFGASTAVFQHVIAWVSPISSALTVIPIYWTGRIVGGHWTGIGAAMIFARALSPCCSPARSLPMRTSALPSTMPLLLPAWCTWLISSTQ